MDIDRDRQMQAAIDGYISPDEASLLRAENERMRAALKDGWATLTKFGVKHYHHDLIALQSRFLNALEQSANAPCDHKHFSYDKHGRRCTCGELMVDFGD